MSDDGTGIRGSMAALLLYVTRGALTLASSDAGRDALARASLNLLPVRAAC